LNPRYIERPSSSTDSQFERIYTEGERILKSSGKKRKRTKYVTQPIEIIKSEYVVTSNIINSLEEESDGIGGNHIEIRRVTDDKIIAFAKYYWDTKTSKACPSEARNGLFVYQFIATALNVINENSTIRGIK